MTQLDMMNSFDDQIQQEIAKLREAGYELHCVSFEIEHTLRYGSSSVSFTIKGIGVLPLNSAEQKPLDIEKQKPLDIEKQKLLK